MVPLLSLDKDSFGITEDEFQTVMSLPTFEVAAPARIRRYDTSVKLIPISD